MPHPLEAIKRIDPSFCAHVENSREFAMADGALPKKFKLLVAMALDASLMAGSGVKSLAQAAINAGATKEEISETLRVVQYICGVGSTYTAAEAFSDMF